MRVLVDIDDVLFPWFDRAHTVCVRAGIANGLVPSSWYCWEDYGCTQDAWLEALRVATLDGSLYGADAEPFPGAVQGLRELEDAGHSIHLVTARGFLSHGDLIKRATVEWLEAWKVPHDSLTFSQDKTVVRVDAAVDDSPRNTTALEAAGVATWLVEAPHNLDHTHPRRVPSVEAFVEEFLALVAS